MLNNTKSKTIPQCTKAGDLHHNKRKREKEKEKQEGKLKDGREGEEGVIAAT